MNANKTDVNDELLEIAKCKNECTNCFFNDKNCKPDSIIIDSEMVNEILSKKDNSHYCNYELLYKKNRTHNVIVVCNGINNHSK